MSKSYIRILAKIGDTKIRESEQLSNQVNVSVHFIISPYSCGIL